MRGNDPKNFDKNYCRIPVILKDRRSHSQFAGSPWGYIFIGMTVMGLFGFLFIYVFIALLNPLIRPPNGIYVLGVAILLFLFSMFFNGIIIIGNGIKVICLKKNTSETKNILNEKPWIRDFPGSLLGIGGSRYSKYLFDEINSLLIGLILSFVIFCTVFLIETTIGFIFWMGVLSIWFWGMFQDSKKELLGIIKYFKYGRGKLLFNRFPFFLGDKLEFKISDLPPKDQINGMTLNLRFIQEEKPENQMVRFWEYYFEQKKFSIQDLDSNGDLPIEWSLPDNSEFTTNLSERPAKYWELEVKAKTPGVDYHERFLLPIYAKP